MFGDTSTELGSTERLLPHTKEKIEEASLKTNALEEKKKSNSKKSAKPLDSKTLNANDTQMKEVSGYCKQSFAE